VTISICFITFSLAIRFTLLSAPAPRVATLLRKIEALGCPLSQPPILCDDIFDGLQLAGAYDTSRKAVIMNPAVPDAFLNESEFARMITHELVHAFDVCRVDFKEDNCKHIACTEIRASNLSGECDLGVELKRKKVFQWGGHQQQCVKRRAELSLSGHEFCVKSGEDPEKKDGAKLAIASVFENCYKDYAPFASN
jgi:mitochondrial inner membrane protease ATP23